jgi:hypothetical protein
MGGEAWTNWVLSGFNFYVKCDYSVLCTEAPNDPIPLSPTERPASRGSALEKLAYVPRYPRTEHP